MHNDSITVSNQSTYIINEVKWSDAGTYKCIANNKLGSDSASKNLTVGKITFLDAVFFVHSVTPQKLVRDGMGRPILYANQLAISQLRTAKHLMDCLEGERKVAENFKS